MNLNELEHQYLNYIMDYKNYSLKTRENYKRTLDQFLSHIQLKGIIDPELITTQIIEDFLLMLPIGNKSKANRKSGISSFFKYLHRKGYIANNPAIQLESIKVPRSRPEFLSKEQFLTLLKVVEKEATPFYKERDLMIIKLFLKTGLRREEVVMLNIIDIDLSKRTLQTKRKGGREVYIHIHDELENDLKKYLKSIKRNPNEPLFMSKRGRRLSASSIWHLVKTYAYKAGFSISVHGLRHTFGTTLLSEGVPLSYIQTLMDHRSSQTTSIYLHVQNNELTQVFNKVSFERR